MCQDTGTATIVAKKGQRVWTGARDEEWLARGIYETYQKENLRYSQTVPLSMFEEINSGTNLPAQIDIFARDGGTYEFLFVAKGGGSANKSMLFQETKALLNPASLETIPRPEAALARHGRVPAVSPGGRHRRHLGRGDDEDGQARQHRLPRPPADRGQSRSARRSATRRSKRR